MSEVLTNQPTRLRVEHLDDALGLTESRPRLSWWLPAGTLRQHAYRIRGSRWDTGRVDSADSVLVPYAGPMLRSGETFDWQVKVWTDAGASEWSKRASWEMGLLDPDDWTAQWIEPAEDAETRRRVTHPAYLLRGSIGVDSAPRSARLYATAHGIYECYLNGHRIGDLELTPGLTSYHSNLQVQAYDVTGLIVPGENVLGALLADGWFRGQTGALRNEKVFGDRLALLAQLHVVCDDGSLIKAGTGPEWTSTGSSILEADLFQGEAADLRRASPTWCTREADEEGWASVCVLTHDLRRLTSSPAPPMRRIQELAPSSIGRAPSGQQVVDFGQLVNGWVRVESLGPSGATLTLTHGELLDPRGEVTTENVDNRKAFEAEGVEWDVPKNDNLPFQVDRVTAAGRPGEAFEPRRTTHGFRYVAIDGHPDDLDPKDVRAVVVHSDLRRTGWFECSDERVNRLHEAVVWTFRGNACDVPTDNPTRERSGWTGDWSAFVSSAARLFDVAGFTTKWLRDLASDQRMDGCVNNLAPDTWPSALKAQMPAGSAGWGDAAVNVPWEIHNHYGDRRVLEAQWPSMVGWVEYALAQARGHRRPERMAARPAAEPHEAFIWDTGFQFGEWMAPGEPSDSEDDPGPMSTAFLHRSCLQLAEIAAVLGHEAAAVRYLGLAERTKVAWQREFVQADGNVSPNTQANLVRALAFNLIPAELRPELARGLVQLIQQADDHLATGIHGTEHILPVLAEMGYPEVAYDLLFQDSKPSWMSMLAEGATAIWESWNVSSNDTRPELFARNQCGLGAVVKFLHGYVGGVRMVAGHPGFRRIRIQPVPGGGLSSARVAYETPYGLAESAWRLEGDRFDLEVEIPPGAVAEVRLPDGVRWPGVTGRASFEATLDR